MLFERANVRQIEAEGLRRWFSDEYFDLIVWYEAGDSISGFQLCYDKSGRERALTWREGQGFSHQRVDDGETPGYSKMTPVLVEDRNADVAPLSSRFQRKAQNIDPAVRSFVLARLREYSAGYPAGPARKPRRKKENGNG